MNDLEYMLWKKVNGKIVSNRAFVNNLTTSSAVITVSITPTSFSYLSYKNFNYSLMGTLSRLQDSFIAVLDNNQFGTQINEQLIGEQNSFLSKDQMINISGDYITVNGTNNYTFFITTTGLSYVTWAMVTYAFVYFD